MTLSHPELDEAAIDRIGRGLLDRNLPRAEWTHAAHFAAALWVIDRCPALVPARDVPDLIRAYNLACGVVNSDSGGYHETITQASIRAALAFRAASPGVPLAALLRGLLASELGDRDWPLAYWTRERLFSVAARRSWVAPDRRPLPF